MSTQLSLPDVASPRCVLASPRQDESTAIWTATHPSWGGALALESYIDREAYLSSRPLAEDGRITPWILTDSTVPAKERPVLSSCETLRLRAILRTKDGLVREGWAHGVGSVFTYNDRRGRGYAAKMMQLLAQELSKMEDESPGSAMFSALYSDIGQEFYNRVGWAPFESTHLRLPAKVVQVEPSGRLRLVELAELRELAERDIQLIRSRMFAPGVASDKMRVAFMPDFDSYLRHFYRQDFMCERMLERKPDIHGALYTIDDSRRVWVVWTRAYYGGLEEPQKNTLYILRLVVEDETVPDAELKEALRAILAVAQGQAQDWLCPNVHIWNPDARVRRLVQEMEELEASFVVRENDSITSLQQFGGRQTSDTEWVINEKFEWC